MAKKKEKVEQTTTLVKVKGGYKHKDHEQVFTSVTTVLGRLSKPALNGWYYKNCSHIIPNAYDILKESQEIGHFLNDYSNAYITGGGIAEGGSSEKYAKVASNFNTFASNHKFKDLLVEGKPQTEIQVYDLDIQIAGSFDRLLYIDGKLVLLDWKTSGAVWDEYLVQLQAYYWMMRDNIQYSTLAYDLQEVIAMQKYPSLWIVRLDKTKDFEYTNDVIKMTPDCRIYEGFKKLARFVTWEKTDFKQITKEIRKNDESSDS